MGAEQKNRNLEEASSERGRRPNGDEARGSRNPRRWSARMKREAVLRLLRGVSPELLSRQLGVSTAKLAEWREAFLAGGEQSLKEENLRVVDPRIAKLERKIGELMMENELLQEKARKLEVLAPNFPWRRSRK